MSVADQYQRPLRDLRISITDRCNLRCGYCMPAEVFGPDYVFLPREYILDYEEMTRLARLFVSLGVEKIRVTGGEPLLRRDLPLLIEQLAAISGLRDLTLTTNGLLLEQFAVPLRRAGLKRVTISLDTLHEATIRRMSGTDGVLTRILDGIEAARAAGLEPLKINCVVIRGENEDSILELARRFRGTGSIVRFIEFMDVGNTNGWEMERVVPARSILQTIEQEFPLEPISPNYPGEVATRWRYRDGQGEIGVISSVTQPFCESCTRARLSADGKLYTCLFSGEGIDLFTPIRRGDSDTDLVNRIRTVWTKRRDRYSQVRSQETLLWSKVEMSRIGG